MCWGMIGYGWKGPFHVWNPETEKEKQETESEIIRINTEMEEEAEKANTIWKNSAELTELRLQELATAQLQRQAEKHVEKLKRSEHIRGVDAWRYVKHVAIPLMWSECHHQLQRNPDFVLMEDGASPHTANYTSREHEKQGVPKLDWVSNSPDFNPVEPIWTLLK
ncbi:hypothetical protein K440DRAFT_670336 [Wilcoxina mikolae CBS 423.85]|nr:hypothetical protein K440DRAFT_670336 [Wilcoxina mikolae CBS 423.85]